MKSSYGAGALLEGRPGMGDMDANTGGRTATRAAQYLKQLLHVSKDTALNAGRTF